MKKYMILLLAALGLALGAANVSAQSDLFGEAINGDFTASIQPGLLEKAADPATTPFDFMLVAKRLGVYGDKTAADAMGKWLGDPAKSHSARTALEEMPFDEALVVLRGAVTTVADPILKAGVIGSLGMRRDHGAVETLLPLLESDDATIAEAAFFALARIAEPSYCDKLVGLLSSAEDTAKNRKTADILLMYGDFLRRDGKEADARRVFCAIAEKAPADFYKEAACYQILLVETDESDKLAAEWLVGSDLAAYRATLRAAQFVKSDRATAVLVAAYEKVPAERKSALLLSLGSQKNLAAQGTLLAALNSDDDQVKGAAVEALKAFSSPKTMARLIDTALAGDGALIRPTVAVIELFDESVDPAILKLLDADAARQKIGAELVGAHKIADGRARLIEMAKAGPDDLKAVALNTLGYIADNETLAFLADTYAQTGNADALSGLNAACGTVTDKGAATERLARLADSLAGEKEKRLAIFKAILRLGGPQALETVEAAALASDRESQDLASQTLGAWMSPEAASILLKLANTPGYPFANRALRGALRLAKQFAMPDWLRRAVVRDALASPACGDKEKEIADGIVAQYHLDLSIAETPDQTLLRNIDIVSAVYGPKDESGKSKDVTQKLREAFAAADSATIAIKGSYNSFFGGDPAPQVQKKLRLTVRYKDDGSEKTVEIGENAPITFPNK